MLRSYLALVGCLFISATAAFAEDVVPDVPPLVVGQKDPASFLVQGILRLDADAGLGFSIATDGQQQVAALYDPYDGTPLFLSNGQRTFAYDLATQRIVVAENSFLRIGVITEPRAEQPFKFQIHIAFSSNPRESISPPSMFQIDKFVKERREKFELQTKWGNLELYSAPRKQAGGDADFLHIKRGDSSWFRFSSQVAKDDRLSEMEASHIGKDLPAEALAFPDEMKFPEDLKVKNISGSAMSVMLAAAQSRLMAPKAMLTAGVPADEVAKATFLSSDGLEKKDANLGQRYRAALKEQGIEFKIYARPAKLDQAK